MAKEHEIKSKEEEREISAKRRSGWKKPRTLSADKWPVLNCQVADRHQNDVGADPDAKWLDGRRFSNDEKVKYILPTDEKEARRIELSHLFWKWMFHGNFQAPVTKMLKKHAQVLDVGCAAGAWTMEMAKNFPNSNFIGIDSGAFLPRDPALIPVNCMFHAQNAGEGILFAPETFDYIMQRHMVTAYDTAQWNTVTKEMFRVTKPGGFVEIVELDAGRIIGGGDVARGAWRIANAFANRTGKNLRIVHHLPYLMTNAGFTIVKGGQLSIPIGKQGGEIGRLFARDIRTALEAGKPLAIRELTMASSFFDDLVNRLFEEFDNTAGVYMSVHIVVYRKPFP